MLPPLILRSNDEYHHFLSRQTLRPKHNQTQNMKKLLLTAAVLSLALSLTTISTRADEKKPAAAEKKHEHASAKKAGPTGGKLITEVEPHVEFFVTSEKKVEIRFVDDDNKIVAPAEQVITATLGDRKNPTKLTFTKDGDKLVSSATVPDGNDYPTVLQIKSDAKAKAVNAKFNLNLIKCPTCPHAEYACICDHGDGHEGHDHKEGEKHDDHDHKKK
jgi:hypothetical protein